MFLDLNSKNNLVKLDKSGKLHLRAENDWSTETNIYISKQTWTITTALVTPKQLAIWISISTGTLPAYKIHNIIHAYTYMYIF